MGVYKPLLIDGNHCYVSGHGTLREDGTLIVWTGYMVSVYDGWNIPYVLVLVLAILTTTLISLAMGRIAFRPFINAPPSTLLLTSFGAALASQAILIWLFGESPRPMYRSLCAVIRRRRCFPPRNCLPITSRSPH